MEHSDTLFAEIEAYCDRVNISPSTLCVRALGNSRFMDRLRKKLEKLDEDQGKLRSYMAENPPAPSDSQVAQ